MDADTQVVVESSLDALRSTCMSDLGFTYIASPSLPAPVPPVLPPEDLLATYGYAWRVHLPGYSEAITMEPASEDPEYVRALNEDCGPAAVEQLDLQDYYLVMQELANAESLIRVEAISSDTYQKANQRWVDCVKNSGYEFRSVDDALADVYDRIGDPSSPEAVRIAQVDYACARESGLIETQLEVTEELQRQWIDENPGLIEKVASAKGQVADKIR